MTFCAASSLTTPSSGSPAWQGRNGMLNLKVVKTCSIAGEIGDLLRMLPGLAKHWGRKEWSCARVHTCVCMPVCAHVYIYMLLRGGHVFWWSHHALVAHTGWSSHHDHHRDNGGLWAYLRSQPRRQSGCCYLTWQVEVFVITLFSFSVSQGLGAIPAILYCIHSSPSCPRLCASCGEVVAFLCSPRASRSILSWWEGVKLILMEDLMDSLCHWEYSSKARGRVEVPQTLEGHN